MAVLLQALTACTVSRLSDVLMSRNLYMPVRACTCHVFVVCMYSCVFAQKSMFVCVCFDRVCLCPCLLSSFRVCTCLSMSVCLSAYAMQGKTRRVCVCVSGTPVLSNDSATLQRSGLSTISARDASGTLVMAH